MAFYGQGHYLSEPAYGKVEERNIVSMYEDQYFQFRCVLYETEAQYFMRYGIISSMSFIVFAWGWQKNSYC